MTIKESVLSTIRLRREMSKRDVMATLGLEKRTAENALYTLTRDGFLSKVGDDCRARYVATSQDPWRAFCFGRAAA